MTSSKGQRPDDSSSPSSNTKDLCIATGFLELSLACMVSAGFRGRLHGPVLRVAADWTGADDVLAKFDARMEWRAFSLILKRRLARSVAGGRGYGPLVFLRCLRIGQWHGLSAPKRERTFKIRLDFMIFCGRDLHAPVPDEATHCRFRNARVMGGVHKDLLAAIRRQIEPPGIGPRERRPVRQTCISAPIRTQDGSKKGARSTPGYKAFAQG